MTTRYIVTRTDHPRGAPETGRPRTLVKVPWLWLARLCVRIAAIGATPSWAAPSTTFTIYEAVVNAN